MCVRERVCVCERECVCVCVRKQFSNAVARGRAGNTQAPPTSTSQAAAAVQVGASPNLMPQLVVSLPPLACVV